MAIMFGTYLKISRSACCKGAPKLSIATLTAWSLVLVFVLASSAAATTYYVDANTGSDTNAGTNSLSPWQTLQKVNSMNLVAGDAVLLNRGAAWSEGLEVQRSGAQGSAIYFGVYGTGDSPVIRYAKVKGDFVTLDGIVIDRNKEASDALQVNGANATLKNLIVRNGTRDGIDAYQADNLLIENCLIHHFLNGSFSSQADAHGIVVAESQGITIRNTEIHHVSGDSFQADANRNAGDMTNNVLIENCHFWTGPLTENFNSGWVKTSHLAESEQQYPGENAIDTKVVKSGWDAAPRMQLTIRDSQFHGWKRDGYIANKAALNLKEKIEAVIEGVTVYDSQIGFRLRGGLGNANVTIQNADIYNCEYAVRTEDNLENLRIENSIFGENGEHIRTVSSSSGFDTWTIANNQFMGSKPTLASDSTNTVISSYSDEPALAFPSFPKNLRIVAYAADPSDPIPAEPDPTPTDPTPTDPTPTDPEPTPTAPKPTPTAPKPTPTDPGDHSHFESEKIKSGVVHYRSWRTQAEINEDFWTYSHVIRPGEPDSGYYDPILDGAIMPVKKDTSKGCLGRDGDFTATANSAFWVQFEIYLESAFFENGIHFNNMKLFRLKQPKDMCNGEKRLMTYHWLDRNDQIEFAGSGCFSIGDTKTGYSWPGDTWSRVTLKLDVANDKVEAWLMPFSTGVTTKIISFDVNFPSALKINGALAQLQSTYINHHPPAIEYDHIIGYRNLIVSTAPIALE